MYLVKIKDLYWNTAFLFYFYKTIYIYLFIFYFPSHLCKGRHLFHNNEANRCSRPETIKNYFSFQSDNKQFKKVSNNMYLKPPITDTSCLTEDSSIRTEEAELPASWYTPMPYLKNLSYRIFANLRLQLFFSFVYVVWTDFEVYEKCITGNLTEKAIYLTSSIRIGVVSWQSTSAGKG